MTNVKRVTATTIQQTIKHERSHQHQGTQRAHRTRIGLRRYAAHRNGQGHRRTEPSGRYAADRSALQRTHPARRRAGTRQDASHHHAGPCRGCRVLAHPVHSRPAARRPAGHADLLAEERGFRGQEGSRLRQLRAGGRDQPLAGQGAVGAARGDAGAAGDHRRRHLPAAAALPRAGHAEPARTGGNLSAARGAGGPFHAQGQDLLPQQAGGA